MRDAISRVLSWLWLLVYEAMSVVLGSLDRLIAYGTMQRNSFFSRGVGNPKVFENAVRHMLEGKGKDRAVPSVHLNHWKVSKRTRVAITHGTFQSPVSDILPPDEPTVHQAHFQAVMPVAQDADAAHVELARDIPWVVHLQATGDEGFSVRRKLLAHPLAQHGIGSVLMQIPFYGKRRPQMSKQRGYQLNTIENLGQQALGSVREANAIVRWLREDQNCTGPIVLSGFSYGGSMAALASLMCEYDHAAVCVVPSHGPAPPFVEGALARTVAFRAFDGGRGQVAQLLAEMDICKIVAEQQRAIPCSSADAETISSSSGATPTPSKRVYIQLSAKHDAYVPLDSGLTLAKAMKSAPGTVASELRILPGGHASALVLHRGAVVKAVVDAVCLLDKQRRDQEGRAETDSDGELEAVM